MRATVHYRAIVEDGGQLSLAWALPALCPDRPCRRPSRLSCPYWTAWWPR